MPTNFFHTWLLSDLITQFVQPLYRLHHIFKVMLLVNAPEEALSDFLPSSNADDRLKPFDFLAWQNYSLSRETAQGEDDIVFGKINDSDMSLALMIVIDHLVFVFDFPPGALMGR